MHLELLKLHITQKYTKYGGQIVFGRGTDVLTKVPAEVIKRAAKFITELTEDDSINAPEAGVIISVDGDYEVIIHKWWDTSEVRVILRKCNTLKPLATWEVKQ